jgi:tetratricopeptide (TPR) repeat protein
VTVLAAVLVAATAHAETSAALDSGRLAGLKDSVERLDMRLGNVESALNLSRADIANMVAQVRYFPIERRLLDADLFYEMKDFEKAATLYRDLAENPDFRGKPGYWRTVVKLGEALFQMRNFQSARRYYEMAATPEAGPEYMLAVARLFEVAVQTRDFGPCERFESLVASLSSSPVVAYSYGKYLYHRGRKVEAQQVFAGIPAASPTYSRAQYFAGVLDASAGRLDAALNAFSIAERQPPVAGLEGDIQGTSTLARARILYELGRPQEALAALQQIDQNSPVFVESLFDTAWAYLKMGELLKAAHALDILLMSSPGGETGLKANALRGRILSRLGDADGATEAYNDVSSTLGPVTSELDKIASEPGAMTKYFDWVIDRGSPAFKMDLPISERTATWLEADPGMASVVQMFGDLSRERENVRESFETVEKLLWALQSGGKLEAFPALKDKFLHVKENEASFLDVAVEAASLVAGPVGERLQGDAADTYSRAVKARNDAIGGFRSGPRTVEDYVRREKKTTEEYKELEKTLFQVESLLRIQRQQVLAIEEWLREQKFRESGTPLSPERETAVRNDLEAIKSMLGSFHQDAVRIRESLDRDTVTNATVAAAMQAEEGSRRALVQALKTEAEVLGRYAATLDPGLADVVRAAAAVVARGAAGASAVEPVGRTLMDVADRGAADYTAAVQREKTLLETQVGDLQKAEMDSRAFAQNEGAAVFRAVKDRLGEVLLEADLGLVDMAWQREQAVSEKLRTLGKEKADRMRGVDEMEEIVKQQAAPAADQAPPPDMSGGM